MTITSATEKPQQMATVGTKITLISKAQVRYEGSLFSVDPVDGTVGLARVRVFGTENRKNASKPVPALDEVYAYILFRGTDIQDLTVNDSVSRDVNNNDKDDNVSAFLTDPAIIKTAVQPPHDPMLLHGAQSGNILAPSDGGGNRQNSRHQYFHPDTLTSARTRHVSESRDERLPQRSNTGGNRRSGQFYRDYGDRQEGRVVYARERDREDYNGRRRGPGYSYGWQPYDSRYDNVYKYHQGGHYPGFDYGPQPPQRVVFLPRGTTRAPGHPRNDDPRNRRERPPDPNTYRMQPQNNRSGSRQGQPILRRPVVMYARQGGPNNGNQGDSRMTSSYVDYRRPQRQRNSSGYYQRQGGFKQSSAQRTKEYLNDYDFEKMNAELELELKKDPESETDQSRGKSSSPETKANGVANGDLSPIHCYDKKSSFFDRITRISDAAKARVDRVDERRINEETFGRQYRSARRGRRGNSRPLPQYY